MSDATSWRADASLVQVCGHVWLFQQILYVIAVLLYRLNRRDLEIDQHHIIMPHRFCDISNSMLEEYKLVNYNEFSLSSKLTNVDLSYGAWPV